MSSTSRGPVGEPRLRPREPAFAVRGLMLDVSRTRVPTMRQLFDTVDLLADCRANHLQLYIEHAFRYRGHEAVSEGASPITPDELTRLSEYARDRGIQLAANQNCLGHMARWLRLPRYADLAETHGRWKFLDMDRSGPFSLCPIDPRSLELVEDLLGQQSACIGEGLFNIGCDESFDIGQGRSRSAVRERGTAAVYGAYVASVCGIAARGGSRPMFWGDIALRHPEALAMIPADAIALAWGYEPDADFARWCRTLAAGGREVWVCPGTSSWRSVIGRTSERRANLEAAVRGGMEGGARGLMICDWGDAGHLQQWPIAERAVIEAMEAAWTGRMPAGPKDATAAWIDELGDADAELRRVMRTPPVGGPALVNAGALFSALWPARPDYAFPSDLGPWIRTRDRLARLADRVPGGPLVRDELGHTVRWALLAAEVGAWRMAGGPEPRDWRARLDALERDHRRLWLIRSRPGGLDESAAVFAELRTRLEEVSLS